MALANGPSRDRGEETTLTGSNSKDDREHSSGTIGRLGPLQGRSLWTRITISALFVILGPVPSFTHHGAVAQAAPQEESCLNEEATALKDAFTSLYPCAESFLKDFWHDEPEYGFHIGCLSETDVPGQRKLALYINGQAESRWISDPETQNTENWTRMKKTLKSILGLKYPGAMYAGSPYQPYAIFSPEGRRLADGSMGDIDPDGNPVLDRLLKNGVFLIYEGGQFLWPGVRLGFQRTHVSLYRVMPAGSEEVPGNRAVAITTLSMRPLVLSIRGFLSDEECTHIQNEAEPYVEYSDVVLMDHDRGRPASDFRTSRSAFLASDDDPILQDIDDRVASLTRIPRNHQEHVQVLRYGLSELYGHHTDYFDPSLYQNDPDTLEDIRHGRRNRLATVFWYLSTVTRGGETVFPLAFGNKITDDMECSGGLLVKPERGKVIIFYSLLMSGEPDHTSLHGACPPKEGIKWAANKWVWNEPMPYTA